MNVVNVTWFQAGQIVRWGRAALSGWCLDGPWQGGPGGGHDDVVVVDGDGDGDGGGDIVERKISPLLSSESKSHSMQFLMVSNWKQIWGSTVTYFTFSVLVHPPTLFLFAHWREWQNSYSQFWPWITFVFALSPPTEHRALHLVRSVQPQALPDHAVAVDMGQLVFTLYMFNVLMFQCSMINAVAVQMKPLVLTSYHIGNAIGH